MTVAFPALVADSQRRAARAIAPDLARDAQPARERFLRRVSPRMRLAVLEEMDAWLSVKLRRLAPHQDERIPGLQQMRRWIRAQLQQGGRRL